MQDLYEGLFFAGETGTASPASSPSQTTPVESWFVAMAAAVCSDAAVSQILILPKTHGVYSGTQVCVPSKA
jgi:hypothetical protein